jgi:dTDP-4-dehydrorhamnose 3,5-epimerase
MTEPPRDPAASSGTPHAVPLSADVEGVLSFQSYPLAATIDGVEVLPLRKHRAENGWFLELYRLADGLLERSGMEGGFSVRQVSAARAEAHRINAFHIHPKRPQHEIWSVVDGSLAVWLVDCRRGSPTEGRRQKVQLSAEEPARLLIPAGVAHGYRAGPSGALLLYAMTEQFDVADPNEGRLPWDHFGRELWEEDRG